MSKTNNIVSFPKVLFKILYSIINQRAFIRSNLNPVLENYITSNISNADITKIKKYYGLAVPAILGEGFCILRGKPLTQRERLTMTYLGSLTGLYDDFFDELHTQENHILELTKNPHESLVENDHESLFIKFYNLALKYSPSSELLKEKFIPVYEAQIQSKLQRNSNLSISQLSEVTLLKGGVSLLFYRSALNEVPDKTEEALLYKLGGLMQLENDIFDIYKDYQDNISTLATTIKKVEDLRETYTQLHEKVIQLIREMRFPIKNKIFFTQYLNLIICRGYVCLDMLEQNEELTNNVFSIKDYSRKHLICDMEKPKNIIKSFNYYVASISE